jgi:phosphoheptose isomerase
VFSHQVSIWGKPGDLLIAMTTSKSRNILKAIKAGKSNGMKTVLLDRSKIKGNDVAEIQENIIKLLHIVAREAKSLESGLSPNKS